MDVIKLHVATGKANQNPHGRSDHQPSSKGIQREYHQDTMSLVAKLKC